MTKETYLSRKCSATGGAGRVTSVRGQPVKARQLGRMIIIGCGCGQNLTGLPHVLGGWIGKVLHVGRSGIRGVPVDEREGRWLVSLPLDITLWQQLLFILDDHHWITRPLNVGGSKTDNKRRFICGDGLGLCIATCILRKLPFVWSSTRRQRPHSDRT